MQTAEHVDLLKSQHSTIMSEAIQIVNLNTVWDTLGFCNNSDFLLSIKIPGCKQKTENSYKLMIRIEDYISIKILKFYMNYMFWIGSTLHVPLRRFNIFYRALTLQSILSSSAKLWSISDWYKTHRASLSKSEMGI